MLSQNRLPRLFIVVDSSNNHADVREIVEKEFRKAEIDTELIVLQSKPGTSYQRNLGLKYVQSPVVLFPDDDSLWFPGMAEAIMRIYEKDEEGIIGAVCAADSSVPPPGVFEYLKPVYRMELRDRVQNLLVRPIRLYEKKFFPDPIMSEEWLRCSSEKIPNWLENENAVLSGPMTGFRMSFRTKLIQNLQFDEVLGKYSLFEDRDASLGILKNYMIVCAKKAKVFHYRFPEKRTSGAEFGMMHILNRTYVICKHTSPDSPARSRLKRFLYYKVGGYILQSYTKHGRQRLRGSLQGLSFVSQLLNTPKSQLPQKYSEFRNECLVRSDAL